MIHRAITGQPRNKDRNVLGWYPITAHQDFFPYQTGRVNVHFNALLLCMQQGLCVHVNDLHILSTCMQKTVTTVRSVFSPFTSSRQPFFGCLWHSAQPGQSFFLLLPSPRRRTSITGVCFHICFFFFNGFQGSHSGHQACADSDFTCWINFPDQNEHFYKPVS